MKKLKIFLSLLVVLIFFSTTKILAHDESSKAFADFIRLFSLNSQTTNKTNLLCLYGSDDISSYLLSNVKAKIIPTAGADIAKLSKSCHIIYIAKNEEKYIKSSIDILNKSEAITLAVFESFVDNGGMIFIDIGRRDFELTVNSKIFKLSGAKLDSSIAALVINTK